jgi:hypothetical protein
MNLDSTIISAIIGFIGALAGIVITLVVTGHRENWRIKREKIERKQYALTKLKNLLTNGKTLYEQAGGLSFEIKYDPEDKSQYNLVLQFIENNAKVEQQLIEAGVPSDRKEVKEFLKNATYLKTQVIEGKTTDWLRSQFPTELDQYVDKELEMLSSGRRV